MLSTLLVACVVYIEICRIRLLLVLFEYFVACCAAGGVHQRYESVSSELVSAAAACLLSTSKLTSPASTMRLLSLILSIH